MMDFIDEIKQLSTRAQSLLPHIKTEEATKHSLILPFIQLLGYNVFDPSEVVPEFTADVGTKKGEKVDYAIIINGKPSILIEAKCYGDKLESHDSQLFRYFTTTEARFAILTNGVLYKFYSDLQEVNKMDDQPFLEFDLSDVKEALVSEVKKFHKENFNIDDLSSAAANLKYTTRIKQLFDTQIKDPSDEFVGFWLKDIYSGLRTQKVIAQFRPIVKKAINQYINDSINVRLTSAIQTTQTEEEQLPRQGTDAPSNDDIENDRKIETTNEELEAFYIIKSILRKEFEPSRITHKDTMSYFGILIDGNIRKWICRIFFAGNQKYILFYQESSKDKHLLNNLNELFDMEEMFLQVARQLVNNNAEDGAAS